VGAGVRVISKIDNKRKDPMSAKAKEAKDIRAQVRGPIHWQWSSYSYYAIRKAGLVRIDEVVQMARKTKAKRRV
jgi:hypothetical protein